MKREVHKLKHEATKYLKGVSKMVKGYGPEAHKHVMHHLNSHIGLWADSAIDKAAVEAKTKAPKLTNAIDAGAEVVKKVVKKRVKKVSL